MKNSELMEMFKEDLPEKVNPSMIQKCVSALPEVAQGNSVVPLFRLQVSYFPKWLYAALGVAFFLLFFWRDQLSVSGMIWHAGQMMYGAALLLGVHVLMAGRSDMLEVECTCKYQYSQIYLARIVWSVCYLFLFDIGLNVIFIVQFGRTKMIWNALILFPMVAGAVCALAFMQFFGMKSDVIPFGVLLGVALAVQLVLQRVIDMVYRFELAAVAVFGILLLLVLVQGCCFMGRRFTYEAYNM